MEIKVFNNKSGTDETEQMLTAALCVGTGFWMPGPPTVWIIHL
jgi:hypothetical protein